MLNVQQFRKPQFTDECACSDVQCTAGLSCQCFGTYLPKALHPCNASIVVSICFGPRLMCCGNAGWSQGIGMGERCKENSRVSLRRRLQHWLYTCIKIMTMIVVHHLGNIDSASEISRQKQLHISNRLAASRQQPCVVLSQVCCNIDTCPKQIHVL